ncbi:MAG: RNA 2'-phosphotransferase [Rhodobiaceae bacterium]|nr:RNA 2'-phosphotransferase [Rhodobiaceae bacterium]
MPTDMQISRSLSYWLRHRPDDAGLQLDKSGWADVVAVLAALGERRIACTRDRLHDVVARNEKNRFELSPDGHRIRARQGHSFAVDLGLSETTPPPVLFHGTVERFLAAIMREGLKPMNRQHVHLSPDVETATKVGARRGKPVILTIDATGLAGAGHIFLLSSNGVWLTSHVPPAFLTVESGPD